MLRMLRSLFLTVMIDITTVYHDYSFSSRPKPLTSYFRIGFLRSADNILVVTMR